MNVDLLTANLVAHWIQAGLIAIVSITALTLLRVKEPRLRLAALQTMLWVIVLVPWLQPWQRVVDTAPNNSTIYSTPAPLPFEETAAAAPPFYAFPASASTIDPIHVALAIVIAGIVMRLSWLAYGGLCLVRFRRNGRAVPVPEVADELQKRLKVSPRYIEHSTPGGPSTFGIFGATIALPAGFGALDPKFQRAIVCHELVHVRRHDTTMALVEELFTALLWFHPWVWLIRSRIRVAREQVVDRMVLNLIGDRMDYARCLIELSGHDLLPHFGTGMLSSHELRARIEAMFQEAPMSQTRRIAVSIALVAVVLITSRGAATYAPLHAMTKAGIEMRVPALPGLPPTRLPAVVAAPAPAPAPAAAAPLRQVAAPVGRGSGAQTATSAAPRARTKMAYAEYPIEALEKGISGTVTVNIAVNAAGDVVTAGVISGPQELRASAFKAALGLKYAPAPSTTAMTVSVAFLLDRQSWGVRILERAAAEDAASLEERLRQAATQLQTAGDAARTAGAIRVGGAIPQPRKIKDVRPDYPAIARTARVQGVVIVEATIDAAGNVADVRVLRSIPLLDQAAVDAVKQWQFAPTLMNGAAVPVIMTATVNFTLSDDVRLRIALPNGSTTMLAIPRTGGFAVVDLPGTGQFGFATAADPASSNVRISIFEMSNGAQRLIGSVDVAPEAGAVQSATTPSFGIEVERVTR